MSLDFSDPSAPYITGNGFATRCARWFAWGSLGRNPQRDNDVVYCKTDDVPALFAWLGPDDAARAPFVLLTHNSDLAIGEEHRQYLDDRRVRLWLAQNPAVDHPKLRALPIGLANHHWPHGDVRAVDRARRARPEKTTPVYANFDAGTDPSGDRARCAGVLAAQDVPLESAAKPFGEYVGDLARSHFAVSPRGRGIDTHRTWEALCVGAIPIVTRSLVARDHEDFPMVVLDGWGDFRAADFTPERARRLWASFDSSALLMDGYLARLEKRFGVRF